MNKAKTEKSFTTIKPVSPVVKIPGTIYKNNGRYWWKVRLPGNEKVSQISLKSKGMLFATKDKKLACSIAAEIWIKKLKSAEKPKRFDGKLSTLVQVYIAYAKKYYLPPSSESENIRYATAPLASYFPSLSADDFTPIQFKEFRDYTVKQFDWNRSTVNRRIEMIKRMFKWAASEMLVSVQTHNALATVEGLRRGRTDAREGKRVLPAKSDAIAAVLRCVTPIVADMIQIQLLTGMRPGELCRLRACDIDRTGKVWIYKPPAHKTHYLGYEKQIAIGPKAQLILTKYLFPSGYCFKPADSEKQARNRKHQLRKTPLSCGNSPGTNNKGTRTFGEHFSVNTYRKAINRACRKAEIENWNPGQLRHNRATSIRGKYDLDGARAVLGHRKLAMTDEYAELDFEKAKKIIAEVG